MQYPCASPSASRRRAIESATVTNRQHILDNVSERDRRAIAIRFLRSDETMGALLKRCAGTSPAAYDASVEMACVLLMARNDAPEDLQMTDAQLYKRLRERITDIRLGGWLKPAPGPSTNE